jgi:hypothetical protein
MRSDDSDRMKTRRFQRQFIFRVLQQDRALFLHALRHCRTSLGIDWLDHGRMINHPEGKHRTQDLHTGPWGVKVVNVEVKQVDMPESMLRAMAKQAEAEREKRSKIIHAEGEFSAAQRLVDAAKLLATEPVSIQLRYLQTLTEIGVEKNTTIVFPLPLNIGYSRAEVLGRTVHELRIWEDPSDRVRMIAQLQQGGPIRNVIHAASHQVWRNQAHGVFGRQNPVRRAIMRARRVRRRTTVRTAKI